MSSERSERAESSPRRLEGSGTVPRVLALVVLVVMTAFLGAWVATSADALVSPLPYMLEGVVLAALVRSLFVGVFLEGDGILVRGWFRDLRYAPGELTTVTALPYWAFLGRTDPILTLLRFTPAAGWVREVSATVSTRDATRAQVRAIAGHLGLRA